jgi:uncharacterized protein
MASVAPSAGGRFVAWCRHAAPTREAVERNRLLRPVATRVLAPDLWRFNRRSVARGVALGASCGVLFPFAHMPTAGVLSVPFRANLPTAVAVTVPSTFLIPGYWWAAYRIGHSILRLDRAVPGRPIAAGLHANPSWWHWLVAQGGPATILGLLVIAVVLGTASYLLTNLVWRWRIARRWRHRRVIRRIDAR